MDWRAGDYCQRGISDIFSLPWLNSTETQEWYAPTIAFIWEKSVRPARCALYGVNSMATLMAMIGLYGCSGAAAAALRLRRIGSPPRHRPAVPRLPAAARHRVEMALKSLSSSGPMTWARCSPAATERRADRQQRFVPSSSAPRCLAGAGRHCRIDPRPALGGDEPYPRYPALHPLATAGPSSSSPLPGRLSHAMFAVLAGALLRGWCVPSTSMVR